jgi:CRP-like cAMP-binding protein
MAEASAGESLENLRKVPLFAGLSEDALGRIAEVSTEFEASPEHVLVQPQQAGAGLFVIEEGSVTVELPGRKLELGPGEFFGELALLREDETHTARVYAVSPCRLLAIRRDDFDGLLEEEPHLAVSMLKVLAERLANANRA